MDKRKRLLRIVVPALIVVVVIGIYVFRSQGEKKDRGSQLQAGNVEDKEQQEAQPSLSVTSVKLEELKTSGMPVVVDFGADSCVPCKEMAPVLKTLHEEWQGKVLVQFMDVWKYSEGLEDFPVQVIPTQFFFDADGNAFVPSEKLQEELEFAMYSAKDTKEHVFTAHQGGITEEQLRKIFSEMGVE